MSEAKNKCQLDGCNRAASTRCFCCNKNVCTRHFTEHIDAVKAQIDPLANEINTMVEKIQGLTIEQITDPCFAQLQQWRIDMHQLIDEIFLAKSKEMEDLIQTNKNKFVEYKKQQSETIMKIQDDVKQLAEDGDATVEQIRLLKNQLASVETSLTSFGKDFLSVNVRVFAQGLVTVSSNLNKPSSSPLPPPPPPQMPQPNPTFVQPGIDFRARRAAPIHPNLITPPQAAPRFSFPEVSSGFQKIPTASVSCTTTSPSTFGTAPTITTSASCTTTSPFMFGATPISTTSLFGSSLSPSGLGPTNNNQTPFGNTSGFQFSTSGQK